MGRRIDQTVADFAESIRRTDDLTVLRDIFHDSVSDLGIRYFAYHLVRVAGVGDHLVHGITTYPDDWVQRYIERDYVQTDPVVLNGLKRASPFHWDQVTAPRLMNTSQRALFREADDVEIRDGFSVPIHGRREFAMMSVVPSGTRQEGKRVLREHQQLLHMMALYYHNHASSILLEEYFKKIQPRLTPRETECLLWVARGKTTWEISVILRISERTVIYYIENAKVKLGVHSRPHAVVKAVMMGLIDYP